MSRNIVGPPPPPLIKGEGGGGNGVGRLVLGGYQKFCQKGEITLKKGGWYRNGGGELPLSYYFTVQLHILCVGKKVKFAVLHFDSSVIWVNHARFSSKSCIIQHCIICILLIHSDSVQKILTPLFKLVWNTQKITVPRQDVS